MALSEVVFRQLRDESSADAGLAACGQPFDVLYRRYHPRLVAMCKRRVGDGALAEDIAQETLVRALTHRDAFDDGRPPWPWLKTIATNLIIDHFRKQVREATLAPERADHPTESSSLEERDLLRRAIERLPRRQRAAVALRYLNDWDAHDAAEFLGVTKPAYDQLLFRARRRLQTEYRRLSQEVSGAVLTTSAWLRNMSRRVSDKAREIAATTPSVGEITSLSATQLAGGAVAFALVLGGGPAPVARQVAPSLRWAAQPDSTSMNKDHSGPGDGNAQPPMTPALSANEDALGGGDGDVANDHKKTRAPLDHVTGGDVEQPEDAHITSVVVSPNFSRDGTAFAAGRASCSSMLCPPVLFRSNDGGASWQRLTATGFESETVLLSPSYGPDDDRFFAMGRLGLQVTADGGETFAPAAPSGAPVIGSAAISPAFDSGDPSILIGSQVLMRYRDDAEVIEPVPSTTGNGPLEPAFSPQYPVDRRIVVGGLYANPTSGRMTGAVHTCRDHTCSVAYVGEDSLIPKVRLASDFATTNRAYAFTEVAIYRSNDGAATFEEIPLGWEEESIVRDLALIPGGGLVAGVDGPDAGLYVSTDDGLSWSRATSSLFDEGVTTIAVSKETLVVALGRSGLACSHDRGGTWDARCKEPSV